MNTLLAMAVYAWDPCLTPHGNSAIRVESSTLSLFFAIHELLVIVPYFLSYILVVFYVFQLMAKHAIDYSVFGGPQNFGKWMDVHSTPSCPAEVITDFYFVFSNCFSLLIFYDISLWLFLVYLI